MGLIQREIESAGISTISVTLSQEIARKIRPPRALYTGLPLGHPLGFPGQAFFQTQVLRLLLEHLERIETPGTLVTADLGLSGKETVECKACGSV